jgi:hypothetical protein
VPQILQKDPVYPENVYIYIYIKKKKKKKKQGISCDIKQEEPFKQTPHVLMERDKQSSCGVGPILKT